MPAHGLHEQRIGGIGLDLAAQPVDLHVDGPLAGGCPASGEAQARHGFAGPRRQQPQECPSRGR